MRSPATIPSSTRPAATWLLTLTIGCSLAVGACGGSEGTSSDADEFCVQATEQQAVIVAPPLTSEAELDATLDFYRLMGQLAPLGIASEWNDLVVNLETAATVIPGDPESEQRVATTAYATEPSAFRVKQWLAANCGLDIPITTIAPQGQVQAITPTVPPTSAPVSTGG